TNAIDTLVETSDTDLGLYGNVFVTGGLLSDDGSTTYAAAAGALMSEADMAAAMAIGDPSFRQHGSSYLGQGETWASATIVENIAGIFSTAVLTGGAGNNTMVVNALGGNDRILSDDTATTTVIDMGAGDDRITVGTVPLVPDPSNRNLE